MKKFLLYLAAAFCFLLVSNSASAQAPNISYGATTTLATNQPITITPTNTGGAVTTWALTSGTLPAGMTFSTTNGTISGTPTTTGTSTLLITATGAGTSAAGLVITVATGNTVQPVISYDTPAIYVVGNTVSLPVTNSNSVNTTSYSITGTLPAGLTFNTATGLISGTTTAVTVAAGVTVTITANTGVTTGSTTVNITVNIGPPIITYPTPPVFTVGTPIASLTPTNTGGAVNTAGNAFGAGTTVANAAAGASGMAVDASGNVYVTNVDNNTVTEYSASGSTTTTTLPGTPGGPVGLVFDAAGDAFVLDQATNSVVEYAGGIGGAATTIITGLSTPTGIAIDAAGNIYVANSGNGTITKYTVTTWALALTITANTGTGFFNRRAVSGGIAVDAAGNIYVVDNSGGFFGFGGSKIDEYTSAGVYSKSFREGNTNSAIYISPTSADVFITSTGFRKSVTGYTTGFGQNIANERTGLTMPEGVVTDAAGDLFVSDFTTGNVTEYPIVKGYVISGTLPAGLSFNTTTGVISGTPLTTFGPTTYTITAYNVSGGGSTTVTISCVANAPVIAYNPNQDVYAVGAAINVPITASATPTIITSGYSTGTAVAGATLNAPWGVTKDAAGDIWVVNSGNNTVTEYNSSGVFQKTVTVTGATGNLSGITINGTTIYLSSTGGGVYSIATTATGTVAATTVGTAFGADLQGIVYNATTGYLYATSTTGNVYRISPAGGRFNFARQIITGLGNATGITVDASGNIYVLTLTGTLTEYSSAGAFERTVVSAVGTATYGVYIDATGDVFISDSGSGTVKEYNAIGTLVATTTAAGGARGLTTDASGDIYVAGYTANTVTEYTPTTLFVLTNTPALPAGLTFNPLTGTFTAVAGAITAPFGPLTFTVTAYSSSGTATTTVTIQCTNGPIFTYTTPDVYTQNTAITTLQPVITQGSPVTVWTISTALPTGLLFNTGTGFITGTPTVVSPVTSYVITGTNTATGLSGTYTIMISVIAGPPVISYTPSTDIYQVNTLITPLNLVNTGGPVTSYSISAALPAGLLFNTATGQITGTPTTLTGATTYTVTAHGTAGATATCTVTISVVSAPIITYAPNATDIYVVGTAITTLPIVNSGSTPVSYAISNPLPTGLIFSTTTGAITGTPAIVSAATSYTVTATDALGNTGTTIVNITCNDAPPTITYLTPQVYTVGTTITPLAPTVTGAGAPPTGYIISGLPAGLVIDPLTGIISGTPTAATAIGVYTVTATNDGGNGTFAITITVNALGPVIAYTTPDIYPVTSPVTAIVPLTPVNSGSTPTSYTITVGALPAGLVISGTTGVISGSPTTVTAATTITIKATDAAGNSGTTTVTISCAAYIDWIGAVSNAWNATGNWAGGVVPTAGNIAAIGVNQTFKMMPIVTANAPVGAIVIGTSSTVVSVPTVTTAQAVTLTVNTGITLTVSGPITYQSDANSGSALTATIAGAGTVTASGINVNATTALVPAASYTQTLTSSVTKLNLSSDVSLTTSQSSATVLGNSTFNITAGTVTLTGKIQTTNTANATSTFKVTPATTATLNLVNVAALSGLSATGTNVVTFNNTGATVNYANTVAGVNQTYYTDAAITGLPTGVKYNSIEFSGLGVATANGTTSNILWISGNFTDATASTGIYVNLSSPTVIFNGTTQTINAASFNTTFYKLVFTGTGTTTINSAGFANLASSGVLTMTGTTTLGANGALELHSDASGSATIAAIPTGCSITGTVYVDRFITGGSGYRGYRTLSSPVHVGTTSLVSMNYLINSCYLRGTTGPAVASGSVPASGFDLSGNPNLYLFRENLVPSNQTFTSGNYRSISNLGANVLTTDSYPFDGETGNFSAHVGDGYLFFFRGDRNAATLAQETVLSYVPASATLQAAGTLNQGAISVNQWGYPGSPSTGLGFTTVSNNNNIEGFNLVGNPYASSIDWDSYSSTTSTAGIYAAGGNVASFAYTFNALTQNFDVYSPSLGSGDLSTSGVPNANIIPSGQGFFVIAVANGATLVFNEAAKTNTQATTATGNLFLGTPAPAAVAQNLRIMLTRDSITSKVNRDGTMIIFDKSASVNYLRQEDAPRRAGSGTVNIASRSADSVALTVNRMPFPTLQSQIIPLTVGGTTTGLYQLNFTATSSIPALYTIYLKDAFKQDSLDIRANPTYSFNIDTSDPTSFGKTRFSLVMRENPALMVHLLNFNATKATGGSQVVWKTENEQNYTNFTVQRSIDGGVTFAVLGGFASSAQSTYSFLDQNPAMKANQYRLMMQDLNGTISYSKVVTLIYGNGDSPLTAHLNVYPNPSADVINLSIPSNVTSNTQTSLSGLQTLATTPGLVSTTSGSTSSSYDIKIIGITGAVIKSATSSSTNWQGSVSGLAPGTYIIQVINNSDKSLVGRSTFVKL